MTSRVLAVAVDATDAESLAGFWRNVLGGTIDRWSDARGLPYVELFVPGGRPSVLFQPVTERRAGKNRVHLDIAPETGEQADEVARVVALGATVLGDEPDLPWVVLADPEGNEFCILRHGPRDPCVPPLTDGRARMRRQGLSREARRGGRWCEMIVTVGPAPDLGGPVVGVSGVRPCPMSRSVIGAAMSPSMSSSAGAWPRPPARGRGRAS